jgi:hypothetical protein
MRAQPGPGEIQWWKCFGFESGGDERCRIEEQNIELRIIGQAMNC